MLLSLHKSVLVLPCIGVDMLTDTSVTGADSDLFSSAVVPCCEVFHAHPVADVCKCILKHMHVYAGAQAAWSLTDSHDSSCLAGSGDGDCGFRALLVAILLQVHSCGPAMGASMAARIRSLFHTLPEWTQKPAVVAGYTTLKVTLLATCAACSCQSEYLMAVQCVCAH